ncbi:hypothetical protein [Reichenbachiella sp.]|uniref:hypothetical protein n=1 Tax=Reichenbachiella sp. TaxID=2184521 RepID=UPI003B5B272F
MDKEDKKAKRPRIPAAIIGYVHDTSDNAVRVAMHRSGAKKERFERTEQEIQSAIDTIKDQITED